MAKDDINTHMKQILSQTLHMLSIDIDDSGLRCNHELDFMALTNAGSRQEGRNRTGSASNAMTAMSSRLPAKNMNACMVTR